MFRVIFYQLLLIVGLVLVIFLLKGMFNALSALAGSLAYWVPAFLFIWRVSRHAGAHAVVRLMVTFFIAEALKLIISGTIFLLLVKYAHIDLLYALIGLIGAIVAFWMASAVTLNQPGVKS